MSLPDLQSQYDEPYLFTKLYNINPVYDNLILNFDSFKVEVIATPGHTLGSVSYRIDDLLFTGDTLLRNNRKD